MSKPIIQICYELLYSDASWPPGKIVDVNLIDKVQTLCEALKEAHEALELINKISSSDEFAAVFHIAQMHHCPYLGESYGEAVRSWLEKYGDSK